MIVRRGLVLERCSIANLKGEYAPDLAIRGMLKAVCPFREIPRPRNPQYDAPPELAMTE